MIDTIGEIVYDSAASLDWNCLIHADLSVVYLNLIISGMLKANELTLFLPAVDLHSNNRKVEGDYEGKELFVSTYLRLPGQ